MHYKAKKEAFETRDEEKLETSYTIDDNGVALKVVAMGILQGRN